MGVASDFKFTQQDLTELNSDGNRERGRYGEDESKPPEDKPEPIPNEDENPSW